jgi:predicted transcriptional regulator
MRVTMTQPISIRLDDKNKTNIDRLAKMTRRSRSYIINEAVESYLRDRIAYLNDLDEAISSIDTQPTEDAERVFAWMKTWGTKQEKPASEIFTPSYHS